MMINYTIAVPNEYIYIAQDLSTSPVLMIRSLLVVWWIHVKYLPVMV